MKKLTFFFLILLTSFLLGGCWDYWGLDQMDIVTGLAVDRPDPEGPYYLTVEIVDLQSAEVQGIKTLYVETQGDTIFEAIRNTKRRLSDKLYGGNMQTLIISHQIAEREGISYILENLLRDTETRETMSVVISQEETAREIMYTKGLDTNIIAYEIHETIHEDNATTASTKDAALYMIYNDMKEEGRVPVLPSIHLIKNSKDEEQMTTETNGIALFRGDRLAGYLPPEKSKYYLFIKDEVENAPFTFPTGDPEKGDVALVIIKNKTHQDIEYQDGQLTVKLKVETYMNPKELKSYIDISQPQERRHLENVASTWLHKNLEEVFKEAQQEIGFDFFSMGHWLYKKDPGAWNAAKDNWEEIFQNAILDLQVDVTIHNADALKNY